MKNKQYNQIQIIPFGPHLASNFAQLNYEWLNEYFTVEPHDLEVLESPIEQIISKGGQILFAQVDGEIVGTVALIPEKKGLFELAKMAVSKKYRGQGIGHQLLKAAIHYCTQLDIQTLYLVSNSQLKPAIHLYEKLGFTHQSMCVDTPYTRCDVRMEMYFTQ